MQDIESTRNQVALITGANGITGAYLVAQMSKEPYWSRIIATSRRPPLDLPKGDDRIEFAKADLSGDKASIVKACQDAGATGVTHFFHMAYLHSDDLATQCDLNVPFFRNILAAVVELNDSTLKRVVLQTGAKHYGFAYKAPPREPVTEDLGRCALDGPPNFYYGQEDFMFELQKGKKWTWNVTRPWVITGLARSGQNYVTSAALYFTIQKYLNEPAYFPIRPVHVADNCYTKRYDVSAANNIADFTTYVALHPSAGNRDYNIVDNDPTAPTFQDFWEYMGKYFGVPVETKVGYSAVDDMAEKVKRGVWEEIVRKHGGDPDAVKTFGTFFMFHWVMCLGDWGCWASMEKAKKEIGWVKRVDSRKETGRVFDEMRANGTIPQAW